MDESGGNSEVARVLRQIDLELEAADQALNGYAITSRHDFINARMQRQGEYLLRLIEEGKHEEAQVLMNTDGWGDERLHRTPHQRRTSKQKRNTNRGK